jgi:hypothetical protein
MSPTIPSIPPHTRHIGRRAAQHHQRFPRMSRLVRSRLRVLRRVSGRSVAIVSDATILETIQTDIYDLGYSGCNLDVTVRHRHAGTVQPP